MMPLFRIRSGFWTTFFFFLFLCFNLQHGNLSFTLLALAALLIHELSHILCCELLGYPVREFSLNPISGCLKIDPSFLMNPNAELLIAGAGPIVNLLMVGGVLYLRFLGVHNIFLASWLQINLLIGIINLIPVNPLDGGRIFHAWLSKYTGLKNAYSFIKNWTVICGVLFLVLGIARLYHQKPGLFFILLSVFIIFQVLLFKPPELNSVLKQLQHKKKHLTKRGFLQIKPVLVKPMSLVRIPLQYYGSGDYLLFFIQDKSQKMSIITEEAAWNSLINQGYDVTFGMISKSVSPDNEFRVQEPGQIINLQNTFR
jgi:stage IV sporulation protein FB